MDWLDQLAQTFELNAPSPEEAVRVLDVARDVAHGVERKITPLSTFLLGMNVERRVAAGSSREEALTGAIEQLRATLPTEPAEEHSRPGE